MSSRAAEWRGRVLLAAFSCVCVLLFVEGLFRFFSGGGRVSRTSGTPISELSATLGWKTRANGSQRLTRDEFDVTIAINSKGLRGPEIGYEGANGVKRLAIMGDSFAHGYYAEESQTLRGRLAGALQSCRVEVLNAGQPGYSTDQEWLYFNEETSKYQPAEVVLLFYYNDLFYNAADTGTANRRKPMFVESENGALVVRPPAERPSGALEMRLEVETPSARSIPAAPTFHHSAAWAALAERLQRSRPDWRRALAVYDLMPALSQSPPSEFTPFGPRGDGERGRVEVMWNRTEKILRSFAADVRALGHGFTVFYVPARFEVNDAAWLYLQRRYESDRPWQRGVVRERLQETLKRLDIGLIDATEEFAKAERSARPAYLAFDGHWNARGNEIAFDTLFPEMKRMFCGR